MNKLAVVEAELKTLKKSTQQMKKEVETRKKEIATLQDSVSLFIGWTLVHSCTHTHTHAHTHTHTHACTNTHTHTQVSSLEDTVRGKDQELLRLKISQETAIQAVKDDCRREVEAARREQKDPTYEELPEVSSHLCCSSV